MLNVLYLATLPQSLIWKFILGIDPDFHLVSFSSAPRMTFNISYSVGLWIRKIQLCYLKKLSFALYFEDIYAVYRILS